MPVELQGLSISGFIPRQGIIATPIKPAGQLAHQLPLSASNYTLKMDKIECLM
jgi:hypothetical protein